MSLPTKLIEATCNRNLTYFVERTNLNIPCLDYTLPLSHYQMEALNMAISNSPVSLISGNPASGKTHIGCFILKTSVDFQKSILVIANHTNTLEAYQKFNLNSLCLGTSRNYLEGITQWLRYNLSQPKINFTPPHLLPDSLLETLQENSYLMEWIELAEQGNKENLQEAIRPVFPKTSQLRLTILVEKLCKLYPLLKQQRKLKDHYLNLSDEGILKLIESIAETIKVPILATFQDVMNSDVKLKQFDMILVEDSHLFSEHDLLLIASMTKKLILLGENIKSDIFFTYLSGCLSPAYRIHLPENFRLHPMLSRPIFSTFYHSQPYSPLRNYLYRTFQNRLRWIDIHKDELIAPQLFKFIENSDIDIHNVNVGILTFSITAKNIVQHQCPDKWLNEIFIDSWENWHGKECNMLLIVCDGTKLAFENLGFALTRASDVVVCFGDSDQYNLSAFRPLFRNNLFAIEREVSLL